MITLHKDNNTFLKVETDEEIGLELYHHFTMFAENYKHHPLFKARRWDGKIRFFHTSSQRIYSGLIGELMKFAESREYPVTLTPEVIDQFKGSSSLTREDFVSYVKGLKIQDYGELLEIRDYQMLGAWQAIKTKRRTFKSNTSSGKSVIQYICIRSLQREVEGKILLVVPSQNLVEQMYSDFMNYSANDEEWDVSLECARFYSGYRFDPTKSVVISTWQSLQDKEPEFFEDFEVVMCDEAHQASAKELKRIIECCVNAEYRLAFTGTIPKGRANQLTLFGLFGPLSVLQTSRQAMDKGYIAELDIKGLALNHTNVPKKKMKYQDEIEFLCGLDSRNNYITRLANSLEGNTLILTARVESHGDVLYKMISDSTNKKVFYIHGGVDAEDREEIRRILEKETGAIVIGSYGCVSTGWSVRNLHNVIFAFPSKSFIRVVQSIGRGLRKSSNKSSCTLIDIADNFGNDNYAWQHFLERLKIYAEEEFKYSIVEIEL